MKMRENSASSNESQTKRTGSRSLSREPKVYKKGPPSNIFKRRDSSRERSNSKSKVPEKKTTEKKPKIVQPRGRTL